MVAPILDFDSCYRYGVCETNAYLFEDLNGLLCAWTIHKKLVTRTFVSFLLLSYVRFYKNLQYGQVENSMDYFVLSRGRAANVNRRLQLYGDHPVVLCAWSLKSGSSLPTGFGDAPLFLGRFDNFTARRDTTSRVPECLASLT